MSKTTEIPTERFETIERKVELLTDHIRHEIASHREWESFYNEYNRNWKARMDTYEEELSKLMGSSSTTTTR